MSCMHQKSAEISDAFRQFFGLPHIQHHPVLIMPVAHPIVHGNGPQPHVESDFKILPVSATPHFDNAPASHHHHHHRHGKFPSHNFQNHPFTHRLNHALLHLGRWEGRAVAFVLGCSIGVLLRLFWVLSIVMYRAIRGRRDDEHEYTHIAFVEEYEEPPVLSPPPIYVYPIDEKVAVKVNEVDAPKAPTTTEESK
ncbi:hypothetical protein CPB84DRAFT_1737631 [Gymnopilus junonius]|uniref:Transmembrane protein n=1 Tax=Gymnopilus junonius TaxID=109634 RepID=A0A9P5NA27_GYMJU|nr:hypothetical protein CPB84DRAFT_1737631 [Gymnopilus junonius]